MKIHLKILWKSIKLVTLGFLVLIMVISMIFANAALAQWRVDVNVERMRMVEQIIEF